jgi:hypothetical protein
MQPNNDQNNQQQNQRPISFRAFVKRFLWDLLQIFFKLKIVRWLSTIVLLSSAIMWLGFAFNLILYIIFIPFSNSSNETNFKLFGWMCAVVFSIVHFSAHYFWFLTQIAFHCYQEKEIPRRPGDKLRKKYALLLFIDQLVGYIRTAILIGFLFLMPFHQDDPFNIIVVPLGRLSLYLIYIGHWLHLISTILFIFDHSIRFHRNVNNVHNNNNIPNDENGRPEEGIHFKFYWYISILMILFSIDYRCSLVTELIIYTLLFFFYRWFFMNFWIIPAKNANANNNPNIGDLLYAYDGPRRWFAIFSKSSEFTGNNQQFYTYKLLVMIVLRLLLTSMSFILTDSRYPRFFMIIYILIFIIFCFLLFPPIFNTVGNEWIIKQQMIMIQVLLITMFGLFVFVLLVVWYYYTNKTTDLSCLFFPFIYAVITGFYHIYHSLQNLPVRDYYRSGIILWQEKHEKISIFMHTHNYMYLFFIFVALFGIAFSNSLNLQQDTARQMRMDRYENKSGTMQIRGNPNRYRLEACHWQYESFNIMDMMLFASLAYMPTDRAKAEIETFYKGTNLSVEFDDQFSTFKEGGHGEITYFTVTTPTAVIVSIRGTELGYEWLIDFDIWTESVLNQIMSVLFPWSRLYPNYLNKLIIQYMSTPERLVLRNQDTAQPKRFYVSQMIKILEKISEKYPKQRSFILVGHSLGGGLAKLAGIGIRRTDLIVSISGPGITYSHTKYDEQKIKFVTTESLNARIFNIIHDRDMVPWADKQEGLVQTITCPKSYSRIQCHAILPMFCNMLQNCGNPRKFTINKNICKPRHHF